MNVFSVFTFICLIYQIVNLKLCRAGSLHRDPISKSYHAIFKDHFFSHLDVPSIEVSNAETVRHCLLRCAKNERCFSTNIVAILQHDGRVSCELLPTDKYNRSGSFVASQSFHHFSITSLCESAPCKHGGTCHALYETDDYSCGCRQGFHGNNCERSSLALKGLDCLVPIELGMESRTIEDYQLSASSMYNPGTGAVQARLHLKTNGNMYGAWSALINDQNQWLQVDLKTKTEVTAIATQGRNAVPQWVTSYKLQYGADENSLQYYKQQGDSLDEVFGGNNDMDTVIYHSVNPPIIARYIRVNPWSWFTWISMRMELYTCPDCLVPLGMESHAIQDFQLSASSVYAPENAVANARLHLKLSGNIFGAWSARIRDQNQWLQVDLKTETEVTAIATQGRNGHWQWVTSYKLQYGNGQLSFQYYKRPEDSTLDKVFVGNNDVDTVVYHLLNPPIQARYIRVRPMSW